MQKKTFAIVRAVAAVVAAFALLAGSGFGFIPLLRGPETVEEGAELQSGGFVKADVPFVMDIFGVERRDSGKAVAYYAAVPIGNTFVAVRFPASEYENALAMEEATTDCLRGDRAPMEIHLSVTGTTAVTDPAVAELLEKWFENNAQWMSSIGLITQVEDYSVYLGNITIESGRVGRLSFGACLAMTIAAAVLLVYAVLEFVLVGAGVYNKKRVNKEMKEPAPAAAYTATGAEAGTETAAEEQSAVSEAEEEKSGDTPGAAEAEDEPDPENEETGEEEDDEDEDEDENV